MFVAAGVVVAVMAETRRNPLFATPPLFVVMPFVLEITKKRPLTTRFYIIMAK